jgi:TonB family protein
MKRILVLLPLFLLPLVARAQGKAQPSQQDHISPILFGGVSPLMTEQTKVLDLLLAGKWQAARDLARPQFVVLAGHVDEYPRLAAAALALEALADAGLGQEGPAICLWNVAQSLDPNLARADLSSFGAAGELFAKRSDKALRPAGPEPLKLSSPDPQKRPEDSAEVKRPEILSTVKPQYPLAARRSKVEGIVIVESIIEKDGSISHVRTLKKQPMGLDLSAMEAVCNWRFKPAILKGEPVKVYYVLTVNFQLQKGPPPAISNP